MFQAELVRTSKKNEPRKKGEKGIKKGGEGER